VLNEQNFRRAYSLAKHHSLYQEIYGLIGALSTLYIHTGRRIEWHRLLREFHSDVADPNTELPIPGREDCWRIVEDLRAIAAGQAHNFSEAERIASQLVAEYSSIVAPFRSLPTSHLSHLQRLQLGTLAEALVRLGEYQSCLQKPECLAPLEEAYSIGTELGDANVQAMAAYYLGVAYDHVDAVKDLDKADRWYCKSLELRGTANPHESAKCLHQRAGVAFERFKRASKEGDDRACFDLLNQGIDFINGAFSLTPPGSVDDLARMHCMAGLLLGNAFRIPEAREHYAKSIALDESQGNLFWASKTREFFAIDLARQGMIEESLQWAQAALDGFKTYGASAAREIEKMEGFIEQLVGAQEHRTEKGR
jgi:tetratricopeptide (TPR) repeat protein